MFFLLSKIIGPLFDPFLFGLLLLSVAGVLLVFRKAPQGRRWLFVGSLAIMICFSFAPIANLLILPLETRYARPARLVKAPAAIVMLTGMLENQPRAPDGVDFGQGADRFFEAIALARQYPKAILVFSGGTGEVFPSALREAAVFGHACTKVGDCCGSNEDRC